MTRLLITGGAGFIGSHVAELLCGSGHEVLVVDDLSSGQRANLAAVAASVRFVEMDVRRRDQLTDLCLSYKPEAVAHLAAIASVPRSVDEPAEVHDVNINGTFSALEAARIAGARRFVFASSAAVYGGQPDLPSRESDTVVPASPYAAQKAAGELMLSAYRSCWGMESVALRFFNVFGERQLASSSYSGVISVFASALRRDGVATIYGDGSQSRDFIYVCDVARAVQAALTGRDPGPEPINIARGASLSVRELYQALAESLHTEDAPRFAPARVGDVQHSLANVTRMREMLGLQAETTLETGFSRLLAWEAAQAA